MDTCAKPSVMYQWQGTLVTGLKEHDLLFAWLSLQSACCCQMLPGHFAFAQDGNFSLQQMSLECVAGDAVDCWAHDLWWAGFISETQADQVLVNFPCESLVASLLCFWVHGRP